MRIGVHLGNTQVTDQHLAQVHDAGLTCVKLLLYPASDQQLVSWPALNDCLPRGALVILRLYADMRGGAAQPVPFARGFEYELGRAAAELRPDLDIAVEIHNEPNHRDGIEGWGKTTEHADSFNKWYQKVLVQLRRAGIPRIALGFPGLALGEWAHGERSFALRCSQAILGSGWLGVHCYWQGAPGPGQGDLQQQIDHPALGLNYAWYYQQARVLQHPHLPIYVTEAGNSNCDNPAYPLLSPDEQANEYVHWCLAAKGMVDAVTFFILGGSEDWRGFEIHPETIRALGELARQEAQE